MGKGSYVYEYPRPMATVDAVVFSVKDGALDVLLIRRKNPPWKGMWALPGGFVEMDESLKAAAARELAEETGLTGVRLVQSHTFGRVDRDPRGRVITVAYLGVIDWRSQQPQAGDDAAAAAWKSVANVPALACDHNLIVERAVRSLRQILQAGQMDLVPDVPLGELERALEALPDHSQPQQE